jgi:hypothetical protein
MSVLGPVRPGAKDCTCKWPKECDGSTVVRCEGCGEDGECSCKCGGLKACSGCDSCDEESTVWGDDDEEPD